MNSDTTQELRGGLRHGGLLWQRHWPACPSWWQLRCVSSEREIGVSDRGACAAAHDIEMSGIVRSRPAVRMLSSIDCGDANVLLEAGLGPILTMWWCCG
jgi:hypothetical protein